MKKKFKLVMAIHNHQPVGNFEHVFKECFEKCYKPFLNVLKRYSHMRVSLHFTGPLLKWIESNHPDYLELLQSLIGKGQIEMLGGGFYEPILSILPKRDAVGQLRSLNTYLCNKFGHEPKGAWLAERVWDGSVPEILSDAGLEYTIIDDTHFKYAGFNQEDINGFYTTEKFNKKVKVIPIDKNLRYMMPFADPQKIIDYIGLCAEKFPGSSVCYADDGEKFGVWPETYGTCYDEKWLDSFFSLVKENSDWLEVVPAGELVDMIPSNGLVYLPDASYEEMLEWALPLNAAYRYRFMKKNLESQHVYGQIKDFIRGGIWPNFLVKYPEANLMYRKMLYVSDKIDSADIADDVKERALDKLYKGQCNCSYWHGLFGGLYLNYLRHSVYSNLINAEKIVDSALKKRELTLTKTDYTSNGNEEFVVENREFFALISPTWGGGLIEYDFKPKAFNLSNVMTRRKEAYHIEFVKITANNISLEKRVDDSFNGMLHYDKFNRDSFMDHFFSEETTLKDLLENSYTELGDFVKGKYDVKEVGKNLISLERVGSFGPQKLPLKVSKKYIFSKDRSTVEVLYEVNNISTENISTTFGTEFNFTLLAERDDGRFYEVNEETLKGDERFLISQGVIPTVSSFAMVDLWSGIRLSISMDENSTLYRYPIETVSQSEHGLERTYQGSSLMPTWNINLAPSEVFKVSLKMEVNEPI